MVDDGPAHIEAFAAPAGRMDLGELDPAATPIGPRSRSVARNAVTALSERLSGLQARLLAQGSLGNPRRVLLVLQGMDTCGKDGVIKHVLGGLNPVGLRVASFGRPTRQELEHDFLWRIERQVSAPRGHRRVQTLAPRGRARAAGARRFSGHGLVPPV